MRNFRPVSNKTAAEIFALWTAMQAPGDREAGPYGGRRLIEAPEPVIRCRKTYDKHAEATETPPPAKVRRTDTDPQVAAKIARLRREYGLSVATLMERFGLSESAVKTAIAKGGA